MKLRTITLSIITLLVFAAVGCQMPFFGNGDRVGIEIVLAFPDYYNHVFPSNETLQADPAVSSSVSSRVLDPSTSTIDITVSAGDLAAETHSFSFSEAQRAESGVWLISCYIPAVPVGVDRAFSVSTADASGTVLTTGSVTAPVYSRGANTIRIPLIPADPTALPIGSTYSASVAYGAMAHFSIAPPEAGTLTIQLTSTQDVDLLVFNSDGTRYSQQFWQAGAPTDETATIPVSGAATFYLGIFGNTADVTNQFTFNPTFENTAGETVTVAGDSSLTLVGGSMQGNDLAFTASNAGVTTFAGTALNTGNADGTGIAAQFYNPTSICTDGTYLYVADNDSFGTGVLRRIDIATAAVTTLVASVGYDLAEITTDGTYLFVADTTGDINRITIAPPYTTVLIATVSFSSYGITTDNTYLYVTDFVSDQVIKMDTSGTTVTTYGSGAGGYLDGTAAAAQFDGPHGATTNGTYIYVSEGLNNTIRKIDLSTGNVTTLAGGDGTTANNAAGGFLDGGPTVAEFDRPYGITTDGTSLYVTDYFNHRIRKIDLATGTVTTIIGDGTGAATDGTGTSAQINGPRGITTDGTSLFIADTLNDRIRRVQ